MSLSLSDGWITYDDPRRAFSLAHPSEWEALPGVAGLLVSIAAPASELQGFRSNMNVVRRVRDRALDLDALAESSLSSLLRLLNEPIVVDVDTDVIAKQPARRMLLAYRQGLFALTSEQWLFQDNEHMWTISAGALTENWDAEADTFTRIARSFTLEAP